MYDLYIEYLDGSTEIRYKVNISPKTIRGDVATRFERDGVQCRLMHEGLASAYYVACATG